MTRSLLVVPAAEDVGLARTCLGLLRALDRDGVHVAYVKPVAQPRADGSPDRSVALVSTVTTLRPPEPLALAELEQQLGEGGFDAGSEDLGPRSARVVGCVPRTPASPGRRARNRMPRDLPCGPRLTGTGSA